ncbi:MAG: FAD-dependent oxidoreductase [Candidatus Thiodiazotropha endolucinida]
MDRVLILGSGLAGYTLAREIRVHDQGLALHMITADAGDFYAKPMLSTGLQNGKQAEALVNASAREMTDTNGLSIETDCRVTRIDRQAKRVITTAGERQYDKLILALGAHPIIPAMRGDAIEQRITINSLYDYAGFRRRLPAPPAHIAVIGPGLIGCEFANDLLLSGYRVTLIGPDPYPISGLLPELTAKALQHSMQQAGAEWRLQQTASIMEQDGTGYRLILTDATSVACDLVLSAVGLYPDTGLAETCGLQVARGVATNRMLQTNDEKIYALGDCAEVCGYNLPYVMPIMHGARALAKTLTGDPTEVVYPAMPVIIKTPLHPIAVAPPDRKAQGSWLCDEDREGTRCLYRDQSGNLLGFAISGGFMAERQALTKALPPIMAARA